MPARVPRDSQALCDAPRNTLPRTTAKRSTSRPSRANSVWAIPISKESSENKPASRHGSISCVQDSRAYNASSHRATRPWPPSPRPPASAPLFTSPPPSKKRTTSPRTPGAKRSRNHHTADLCHPLMRWARAGACPPLRQRGWWNYSLVVNPALAQSARSPRLPSPASSTTS